MLQAKPTAKKATKTLPQVPSLGSRKPTVLPCTDYAAMSASTYDLGPVIRPTLGELYISRS